MTNPSSSPLSSSPLSSVPPFSSSPALASAPRRAFLSASAGGWIGFAALLVAAPLIFSSSLALTMLSQMGYMVIICLSYNLLFGQGGMLSFGHAVYSGLGAFMAIHALNAISAGALPLPVSLVPLAGGLAGAGMAALLGWVTTKKSANTFAMITLGVGELVFSMSLMFPGFFGGEGGVSANRVAGQPFLGITFGPQIEVYYLIAAYCFISTATMFALTRTPFGRMLNAVRDNPQRVGFIGYNTQVLRYIAFVIAGFFAGIGGGLIALNFEIVTAESVSSVRSGQYLLFTFMGGAGFFIGPIVGAVLSVLALVLLSELTPAWLIYLGIAFLLMVMFAPGGIASLWMMNLRVAAFGLWRRLAGSYLALLLAFAVLLAGLACGIEMLYRLQLQAGGDTSLRFLGLPLNARDAAHWAGAVLTSAVGAVLFEIARRRFKRQWAAVQQAIDAEIQRRASP